LVRETTLAPEAFLNKAGYPKRRLQEPASVAWNLSTGLYYKTQPEPPWKLASVRPGVCYIGLVFKRKRPAVAIWIFGANSGSDLLYALKVYREIPG
jgi:hypothetical protein